MTELTDKARWELVAIAIKAFTEQYPKACKDFFEEVKSTKTEFGLADDKELQRSGFRSTLAFPVCKGADGDEDSLLPVIERYLPGFRSEDSKYFKEFIKRYPNFSPAKKL